VSPGARQAGAVGATWGYAVDVTEVVVIEAVRSPIGRRGGGLSTMHPAQLLGAVQKELIDRAGIDPAIVEQVVGGCVSQVGEQSFNITRTAWLSAGLPITAAATTVDSQCGSSQQATNVAASLVASGAVDVAVACGVESMSRIPIGSSVKNGPGRAIPKAYFGQYEFTSQFEAAERIATKWGITREDTDTFGYESQRRAAVALAEGRFEREIVPIDAPILGDDGKPTGETRQVSRDEGPRETTMEALAGLKPVAREDGVHTAGTSSQISDGAGALLLMSAERAAALGLTPRARIVHQCLTGTDPVLMLTGPIDATFKLLERSKLSIDDMDTFEVNEAFASVVVAWERECHPDMSRANPNGGAIALGHPLGGTGAILAVKALHELERIEGRWGLITMCCGGGLGTGTLMERL